MDFIFHLSTEIFLAISALILLLAGAFSQERGGVFVYKTSLIVMILAGYILIDKFMNYSDVQGMFTNDLFGLYCKMLIIIATFFILLMAGDYFSENSKDPLPFEFPILIILSVVGMMVMVSSSNFMSLYMGLELQSLSLYILTSIKRKNQESTEAGLKYFMLGALSSGILLYGCSLIYGFVGSLTFSEIAMELAGQEQIPMGAMFGLVFVFVGICFKLSAVPFHMWAPDVYQGAPKIVTAFLATAPKIAAVALLIRVSMGAFIDVVDQWQQIIIFVSMASMLVGGFGALRQTNIKRLLAYSSIGHMGFLLVGLAAGNVEGVHSVLIYIALYVVMSLGTFACVILMKRRGEEVQELSDLSGIAKDRPIYAASLCILMFSMAGIPPLAGFFGKLYVFKAALAQELYSLAIVGVLSSVIAGYYYIKIVKIIYFDKVRDVLDTYISLRMRLLLGAMVGINLLFFIAPSGLINISRIAAESLF